MADLHCYHVIFGASSDNGYARLLGPYSSNEKNSKRITMLTGPPLAKELAELAEKLNVMSAPSIFRSTKIPSRRVSILQTPPASPPLDYASIAATGPAQASLSLLKTRNSLPPVSRIAQNSKGQRVDIPLRVSHADVANVKTKKYCNSYHLNGECHYEGCAHTHGTRLVGKPLETLRHIARMSPCPYGLQCDYEDCTMGHKCTKVPCTLGTKCWFSAEMHGVDTKIV
jgi:hypothetical protein